MNRSFKTLSATTLALFVAASFSINSDAFARERSRSSSASGPRGHSLSKQSTVTAGSGDRTAERSIEGPNGRGVTHDANRSYDPATGSLTRESTTTTNSGASISHESTASHSDTGTASHSSSTTGPNGGQVTDESSISVTHP